MSSCIVPIQSSVAILMILTVMCSSGLLCSSPSKKSLDNFVLGLEPIAEYVYMCSTVTSDESWWLLCRLCGTRE